MMTDKNLDEFSPEHRPTVAVVVAHPDDEVLWCGGYILTHPAFAWRVVTLCRGGDPERSAKFQRVLQRLGAAGAMADLDDGPEQTPLPAEQIRETIIRLLAGTTYDLILTHGPNGEYTSHIRHVECSRNMIDLWRLGNIETKRLWLFAYEDGGRAYLPRVREDADRRDVLTENVWRQKYSLITDLYGFGSGSWEAHTTPREEGFWCFDSPQAAERKL